MNDQMTLLALEVRPDLRASFEAMWAWISRLPLGCPSGINVIPWVEAVWIDTIPITWE